MHGMDFDRAEELLGMPHDQRDEQLMREQDRAIGFLMVNAARNLASIAADLRAIRNAQSSSEHKGTQ